MGFPHTCASKECLAGVSIFLNNTVKIAFHQFEYAKQ